MTKRFDTRTALIIVGLTILGAAWAYYNYVATGGRRDESVLRALVWAVFATPFATFIGWLIARPREGWLAAYICFCIYFFTTFVAARIESFFYDATAAEVAGHPIYFPGVIIINFIAALVAAVWRARTPYAPAKASGDEELSKAPEASAS
mgnify:CR=1 FL=1|jgi:hypothetical protein